MDILKNPEYDDEQTMQLLAKESELFNSIVKGLVNDTDEEYPSNSAWLGTLNLKGRVTQVQLVVTQETEKLIDEN